MAMTTPRLASLASLGLLAATPALAHTGVGATNGLAAGFGHPLGGLDHALAMLAVGWLAARIGGRALALVPAAFLGAMALGGGLAMAGLAMPAVELGIGLSVVAFGILLAWPRDLPAAALALLVGAFALFHGHAHGTEMPADASGLAYGAGFLLATAALHLAGIATGMAAERIIQGRTATRLAGAATAVAGLALLAG